MIWAGGCNPLRWVVGAVGSVNCPRWVKSHCWLYFTTKILINMKMPRNRTEVTPAREP